MKGTIKLIPVLEIIDGEQYVWENRLIVKVGETDHRMLFHVAKNRMNDGETFGEIDIEYTLDEKHPLYKDCASGCFSVKYSQWQYIIDNNLIDKEVEFKVIKTLIDADPPELRDPMVGALKTVEYAELVIEEERMYTKDEVVELLKKAISYTEDARTKVDRVAILIDSSKWIEENLKK